MSNYKYKTYGLGHIEFLEPVSPEVAERVKKEIHSKMNKALEHAMKQIQTQQPVSGAIQTAIKALQDAQQCLGADRYGLDATDKEQWDYYQCSIDALLSSTVQDDKAAIRNAALEEAANICDGLAELYPAEDVGFDCGYTMASKRASQEIHALMDTEALASSPAQNGERPVPMTLYCPACGELHIDEGEWATRLHKTHQCQKCKHEWRPFEYATVGIAGNQAQQVAQEEGAREQIVDDLAMLVRRLVRQLEKVDPGKDLGPQALDYLCRKGLQGSPLRAAPQSDAQQSIEKDAGRLRVELEDAAELLDAAADEIQDWGAYASEYFQDKHDLKGTVSEYRKHAARFEAIAKESGK